MKKPAAIIISVLLLSTADAAAFEDTFSDAQNLYDDGRYAEAALLYEELLDDGIDSVEVRYNLANAYFRNARLPEAVRHYRTAWYAAPRDPDIRANMHFALNAAGAIEPAPGLPERTFATLAKGEWIAVATGAYLLLMLLLILGLLIRPARRSLFRLTLLPAALILLSAGGWQYWKQMEARPEWIVVKAGATALYGPVEGSTAHYKIPLAALVRQRSTDTKGWVEIEYDEKNGWLREEYIQRVSP